MIMDQYVIDFEYCMLYYDMIELVELIRNHGSDDLKCYTDSLQGIIDNQIEKPTTKTTKK